MSVAACTSPLRQATFTPRRAGSIIRVRSINRNLISIRQIVGKVAAMRSIVEAKGKGLETGLSAEFLDSNLGPVV